MKIYCITDSSEIEIGLKLAGCDGITLTDETEILDKIDEIMKNKEIGVLAVTQNIYNKVREKIDNIRLNKRFPLITII